MANATVSKFLASALAEKIDPGRIGQGRLQFGFVELGAGWSITLQKLPGDALGLLI